MPDDAPGKHFIEHGAIRRIDLEVVQRTRSLRLHSAPKHQAVEWTYDWLLDGCLTETGLNTEPP
ncbi:hypothetical protein E3E14_31260 [Streptomyces sp. ICN441]|uniref:hypothetical protein n=1 Tax=Streptomyces sp. ICN441 TaxID=2558286 RepID=UPI00106C0D7B|nr:hypothetical protein [Streptomyces sp. ICN441]TFE36270.1 hypothetical protein E3E14_31260 [Streptomyces sp. ICN441]